MNVIPHSSPNYGERPGGSITAVVVHGTAGRTVAGDLAWLCDEAIGADGEPVDTSASYHYLIGKDGTCYQLVEEGKLAWHAGASSLGELRDVNDFSIGIGLTNRGPKNGDAREGGLEPYPDEQIMVAAELIVDICKRHRIPWHRVVTHAQVSPGRKTDPWLHFPIGAFAGAMLSFQMLVDQ